MRVVLDINMDGYFSWEEEKEAIRIYIKEALDFSACSVNVISVECEEKDKY